MNKQLSTLLAGLLAMAVSAGAQAAELVEWNLYGLAGTESGQAATNFDANLDGMDLLRGAGLVGNTGANSLNAKGWNGEAGDYFSFGFVVADGYSVDLSSLIIASKSSSTGPGTMGLFYSGNGFSTALATFVEDGSSYVNSVVDLSSLTGLTGAVEFRVAQIGTTAANGGSTSGNGTFRITRYYDAGNYINPQLSGTVMAAVPEPETYALMLAGLGLVGFMARRRQA